MQRGRQDTEATAEAQAAEAGEARRVRRRADPGGRSPSLGGARQPSRSPFRRRSAQPRWLEAERASTHARWPEPAVTLPFVQRQEVLLWNPLAMAAFLLLITAEWLVRKFSNLS